VKVISNFLQQFVQQEVVLQYGKQYEIRKDEIFKNFKNYPYPKKVGYWFLRGNDLFLVVNDD
jgi:hypothetical protein